ncbi:hypothetical protein JG687_00015770, partial [Phytophthora cactorum]
LKRLQDAFEADYVGTANSNFYIYLVRCWTTYKNDPDAFSSTCVSLTQISGFGKSRLLREIA